MWVAGSRARSISVEITRIIVFVQLVFVDFSIILFVILLLSVRIQELAGLLILGADDLQDAVKIFAV